MADVHAPGDSNSPIVLLGTTEAGKDINLVRSPGSSVRIIQFGSGGQLPKQLQGGFSSVAAATKAAQNYLAKVKAKEIKADGTKYSGKK